MRTEVGQLLFRLGDRLNNPEGILSVLDQLQYSQWLPEHELRQLSWTRFQALLHYAYTNVPYYRRALDTAGIHPSDITEPQHISRIPILRKADVQAAGHSIRPARLRRGAVPVDTSGSTGKHLSFLVEKVARSHFLAAQLRGLSWYGIQPGEPMARVWGVPFRLYPRLRERVKDRILNRLRLSVFDMDSMGMRRFIQLCRVFRPSVLYGYASAVARLAQFVNSEGLSDAVRSLRVAATTSEVLYAHHRQAIHEAFAVPVANEYGCCEVGIIAYQCPEGALHIAVENVLVEVVRDGQPVQPGESGTILVTGLLNRATPFIRYELGDIGALEPNPCRCGRGLPTMSPVVGRTTDWVQTRDGQSIPAHVFMYAMGTGIADRWGIREYRVIQQSLDHFRVQVVPSSSYRPEVEQSFAAELRRHIGATANVSFEQLNDLPKDPSGKLRYFVSEIGTGEPHGRQGG